MLQNNNHNDAFRNIMQSNLLFPSILEPTRVASVNKNGQITVTESLIDNIFIHDNLVYNSGLIYCDISDHYPIFISIPLYSIKANSDKLETSYRLKDEFRIRKFKSVIQNSPVIQALSNEQSAQNAFTKFFNEIHYLYDKHFPIITKTVTKKSLNKPWVTDAFVEQIKYKHDLAKLFNRDIIDKKTYTDYKNRLTKDLREAKARYFASEFHKNQGKIKGTWKIINNNIKSKARFQNIIIKENNITVSQKALPNKFIKYFTDIPLKLISKINPSNMNFLDFLKDRTTSTFFMGPIS